MFEGFTSRARRVVALAQEEARGLLHGYIGTEHIALALAHEGTGIAGRILQSIAPDDIRSDIERIAGVGSTPPPRNIPLTPRAKRVLALPLGEALSLGHNYVDVEHILLGLLREAEGLGAKILCARGLSLAGVRAQVISLQQGSSTLRAVVGMDMAPGIPVGIETSIVPTCRQCSVTLPTYARYKIVDVAEHQGDGTAQVLFLFCSNCGFTIDDVMLPDGA